MHSMPCWKQRFDGTQLAKELDGPPICEPLLRRPDMICQARCHRWGHGSPQTRRSSSTVEGHYRKVRIEKYGVINVLS